MVSTADIVLCDFTGAKAVSIGCCFEIAVAAKLGNHTIVVMEDGNPHDHRFVREAADIVFASMDDAISYILQLP